MPDMLIRGVPEETHGELKRRAAAAGVSLQAYVLDVLGSHASKPTLTDWLGHVRAMPAVRTTMTGAQAVAAGRADVDERD